MPTLSSDGSSPNDFQGIRAWGSGGSSSDDDDDDAGSILLYKLSYLATRTYAASFTSRDSTLVRRRPTDEVRGRERRGCVIVTTRK
mmetsp:Transcript_21689/g.44716  ORF Transcript_21689/g.44716 Transcript_21689/m.44716 type:complete len:86 (-) Transcript_21689:42-299(-)